MSGDPEQEYFADGMVEEIITGLSRIKWLFVIARNSSFVYKGKAVDVKQVGRELGVRYVLEGSVRKAGGRVRITGQLVEAETGAHLWADKFDGALDDVFDLQDRITTSVVGVVEPSVRQAEIERARRKRPDSLGAYDLFLRAVPYFQSIMPGDANVGIGLLEEALKLDPNYAAAHAYMAWGMEIRVLRGGFNEADAIAGVRHARMALAHGTDDATALSIASLVILHLDHDFEAASGAIARALSLNGSCAAALYWGAHVHAWSGDPVIAEDYANRALRLSPFDPVSFEAYLTLGTVRFRKQHYDDAAAFYAKAVQANPRFSSLYAAQTTALAMAGRIEESKSLARRLLELEPDFRVGPFMEFFVKFARPEIVDGLAEGLRKAGLPE
jgi:adenylate cyclase